MAGFGESNPKKRKRGSKKQAGRLLQESIEAQGGHLLREAIEAHRANKIHIAEELYLRVIKSGYRSEITYSNLGVIYKNTNRQEEALKLYRKSISINPEYSEAYINIGNLLREQGRHEHALEATLKALAINPNDSKTYFNLGLIYKELGITEKAIASIIQSLSLNPDNPVANEYLVDLHKGLGNYDAALEATLKWIEHKPDNPSAYMNLSNIYQAIGKLDMALTSAKKSLKLNPNHPDAYLNLGSIYHDLGEVDQALNSTLKSLELNPGNPDAYLNLGSIYQDIGKLDLALTCTKKSLKLNPNNADVNYNLGVIYFNLGRHDQSLSSTLKALEIDPNNPNTQLNLGGIYRVLGNLDQALASTLKSLELNPRNATAHMNLGGIYKDCGNLEKALKSTLKSLELDPNNHAAHMNLGCIYKDLGNHDEAIASSLKSLELKPDNPDAHMILGGIYKDIGDLDKALTSTLKSIELKPDNPDANMNVGLIYKEIGNTEQALEWTLKSLRCNPDKPEVYINLGSICQELGKLKQALTFTKKSIELDPESAEAQSNLGVIYKELGEMDLAKKAFANANAIEPTLNRYIAETQAFNKIHKDNNQIDKERRSFIESLRIIEENPSLRFEENRPINLGIFWIAYQGREDDNILIEKFGSSLEKNNDIRRLAKENKKMMTRKNQNSPIHIGIISDFWGEHHPVNLHYSGIVSHLAKTNIKVEIITGPNVTQSQQEEISKKYNTNTIRLTSSLKQNCQTIKDLDLDLLLYPDIGMSSHSYFLGLMRLAPVQAVMAGHPSTTGLKEIDYFISSELMEGENAQDNYTEQLVKFKKMPTTFRDIERQNPEAPEIELDKNIISIGIIHSLFKLTPDFDVILEQIAETNDNIEFILFETHGRLSEELKERWLKTAPMTLKKSRFFPKVDYSNFIYLVQQLDFVLDPIGFGAGTVFYQCMSCNVPVITMPTKFLKTRVASGGYKQMKVSQPPIARDNDEYLRICKQLIDSKDYREKLKRSLKGSPLNRLFDHRETLIEYEQFIRDAVIASRKNRKLPISWQANQENADILI